MLCQTGSFRSVVHNVRVGTLFFFTIDEGIPARNGYYLQSVVKVQDYKI